jgi:hypothetical protein
MTTRDRYGHFRTVHTKSPGFSTFIAASGECKIGTMSDKPVQSSKADARIAELRERYGLLPLDDVAALLDRHPRTLRRAMKKGEVPLEVVTVGARDYVTEDALDEWLLRSGPRSLASAAEEPATGRRRSAARR